MGNNVCRPLSPFPIPHSLHNTLRPVDEDACIERHISMTSSRS